MTNPLEANLKDLNGFPQAIKENVYGWILTRSPVSFMLFNVTGINKKGEHLCQWATDLSFDDAAKIVEQLNY